MSWQQYAALGGTELWNWPRTVAYAKANGMTWFKGECEYDLSDLQMPDGSTGPFHSPITDSAWWADPSRPESGAFCGFIPTRIEGIDGNTVKREVKVAPNGGCNGRVIYGPLVQQGYEIQVEGILVAKTCCAGEFGLRALRQALRGCATDACGGTTLRMISCIDETKPWLTDPCGMPIDGGVAPKTRTSPWRTLGNVALIEEPHVVNKSGTSCGCSCAERTTVQFTLRANPGLSHDRRWIARLDSPLRCARTPEECESWFNEMFPCDGFPPLCPESDCKLWACTPDCPPFTLVDPACKLPTPPKRPTPEGPCFCAPLFVHRTCFEFDTTHMGFGQTFPIVIDPEIFAGNDGDLRNLTVRFWRKFPGVEMTDEFSDFYTDCNSCCGFGVSYIPAGATWTRSAISGRTVVVNAEGKEFNAESTLFGPGGKAYSGCCELPPGEYICCVEYDPDNTPCDFTMKLWGTEREP